MSVTISAGDGSGSTTPLTILSPYETTWSSRNVVHDLIGGGIAVSLVTPRPRSGELELLYETETDAFNAAALHRAETTFTLTDDGTPHVGMSYVVDGEIAVRLDEDTLVAWIVRIGYQEIIP